MSAITKAKQAEQSRLPSRIGAIPFHIIVTYRPHFPIGLDKVGSLLHC